MDFSKVLRQLRAETGMTQADLAEALHINVATVSRWEKGHHVPGSTVATALLQLAKRQNVSSFCLFRLESALRYGEEKEIGSPNHISAELANQILNDSANAVYVCDCETCDLIYINQTTASMLGKPLSEATGKKCYEYLMDRDMPCPFCSMDQKSTEDFSEVDFFFSNTNRHFFMRGKLIDWKGRRAHIEYVTENTNQNHQYLELRNMLAKLPCGVGIYNLYPDGRLEMCYVNEGYYRVLRTNREERNKYWGFEVINCIHPEDQSTVISKLMISVRDKAGTDFTVRVKGGDGGYLWLRVSSSIAFEEVDKTVLYLSFFYIDQQEKLPRQKEPMTLQRYHRQEQEGDPDASGSISLHREDENKDKYEYERRLRQELIADSISYYRINVTRQVIEEMYSRVIDVSRQLMPLPFDKMAEVGLLQGISDVDRSLVARTLNLERIQNSFGRGKRTETIQYRRELPGKGLHWIEGKLFCIRRNNTNEIIAFYITQDIDYVKKAQMAIRKGLEEETENMVLLNLSTRMAQYIMKDGMFLQLEEKNRFRADGSLWEQLLPHIVPEELEISRKFMDMDTLEVRLKKQKDLRYTCQLQGSDGAVSQKRIRIFYLEDSREEVLILQRDITELYLEEQKQKQILVEAINRAEQANRAKNDFLVNMSHDMRTPLNTMIGLTALTLDEADHAEMVKENMTKMRSVGDYMLGLVKDILDAAKFETTTVKLHPRAYTYQDFLLNIKTVFAAQCRQKQIIMTYDIPEDAPAVLTDKIRLNQIFFHIMSNAIKDTNPGGTISFAIKNMQVEEDCLRVDYIISDEGSGLELNIVKNLVNLMGGTIDVESRQGMGTSVTLHLCLALANTNVLERDTARGKRNCEYKYLEGKTVLLVEDHPTNAMITARLLSKKGIVVINAANGVEAVEIFSASAPGTFQGVLMDIRMPQMDGYTATRRIRALKRKDAATIPIIAMSANAFEEDKEKSKRAGMNDHLEKPIDARQIYRTLEKNMKRVEKR